MQTWYTTITDIQPIPNKDRIVLATVNGYQSIVGAGTYNVGTPVVYISEGSIVPDALQEELGLTGRLAGSAKNRVKAIRMGGVLSQGIICRPVAVYDRDDDMSDTDLDALLGITKHEAAIPIHLSGKVGRPNGNAPIVPMWDVENIKKLRHQRWTHDPVSGETIGEPWWADPFEGQRVRVTEKLHGTNFAVHLNVGDDNVYVYSKGLGQKGHILLEDDTNTYWRALKMYPQIVETMRSWQHVASVTVRGEIIGKGIQDLDYGIGFDLALFGVEYRWHDGVEGFNDPHIIFDGTVPTVPVLYEGPYSHRLTELLSEGQNIHGVPGTHVREGVVCMGLNQFRRPDGNRNVAKFINPDYLTRPKGTEYN